MKPSRDYGPILVGFACSALATIAGIFLPLIIHAVPNLPWEVAFGFAYYVTGFFRSGGLGERFDGIHRRHCLRLVRCLRDRPVHGLVER